MPISPVCFVEWRNDVDRFIDDFQLYAGHIAGTAGLKPKLDRPKMAKAHSLAVRHIDILEKFFLPEGECENDVVEADQIKQVGTYLHFVSRTQPISGYTNLPPKHSLERIFTGDDQNFDTRSATLFRSHPTDGIAAQYFYEVAANFERAKDHAVPFRERANSDFFNNLCVYLQDGRHDPDGLYLVFLALLDPARSQ